nr:hypothetical protein [Tanacetum cinerariifolium]
MLKGKNLWDIELNMGNGKTCSVWFDKWPPRGPLSKLIDHRVIYLVGLDINAKVIDLIENNNWCCPIDWMTEYDTVIDVPVLTLNNDVEDRIVWCNKKGKEKDFSASEVWKAINIDYPKEVLFRTDDEVVQDQRQRDDNDLQDERQDQPKE